MRKSRVGSARSRPNRIEKRVRAVQILSLTAQLEEIITNYQKPWVPPDSAVRDVCVRSAGMQKACAFGGNPRLCRTLMDGKRTFFEKKKKSVDKMRLPRYNNHALFEMPV